MHCVPFFKPCLYLVKAHYTTWAMVHFQLQTNTFLTTVYVTSDNFSFVFIVFNCMEMLSLNGHGIIISSGSSHALWLPVMNTQHELTLWRLRIFSGYKSFVSNGGQCFRFPETVWVPTEPFYIAYSYLRFKLWSAYTVFTVQCANVKPNIAEVMRLIQCVLLTQG